MAQMRQRRPGGGALLRSRAHTMQYIHVAGDMAVLEVSADVATDM